MATSIKKKPTAGVSSLTAPTRASGGSTTYTASWKTNSSDLKDSNDHRATGYRWWWVIDLKSTSGKTAKWTTKTYTSSNMSSTSKTVSLGGGITLSNGNRKSTSDLFPRSSSWYVASISFNIQYTNSKGHGPTKTATRKHGVARNPEISELAHEEETGHVVCTIKSDAGNDYRDRYDTKYTTFVRELRVNDGVESVTDKTIVASSTKDTIDASYDAEQRFDLGYDEYVLVRVTAQSRGYSGPSGNVSRELYVSWPKKPSIITERVTCPTRDQGGKITIPIDLNSTTEHPCTGCRLQVLANVEYASQSEIPGDADWTDVGVPDDGECKALTVDMSQVMPEDRGKRSWVRVMSWNQIEDAFFRYSDYYQLEQLYAPAPTAEGDECAIVSCVGADDGKGAVVTVGFDDDGNTGTEVAWSDREDAWTSTDQPEMFQATWEDASAPSASWDKGCTIGVRGLEEGVTYYIRARRYLEGDDDPTYGEWSATKSVTPSVAPGAVTLSAPASIPRGSSCPLTWTFTGGVQTAWTVTSAGRVVASGTDAMGSCSIGPDVMESIVGTNHAAQLAVTVATSGGTATSDEIAVVVDEPPVIELYDATVTAQPLAFTANCSTDNASVAVTVRAQGATATSLGQRDQAPGDVVWSEVVAPEWTQRTLTSKNLASNRPDMWMNGSFEFDPPIVDELGESETPATTGYVTSGGLMMRTIDPILLEQGVTYTLSVGGEWTSSATERWMPVVLYTEGGGTFSLQDGGPTITLGASDIGVYIVLVHQLYEDGAWISVNAAPMVMGSDVLVQVEQGSVATDWVACAADLPQYEATIYAPNETDLRDGALYTITATTIDNATGLSSAPAECDASVAWVHQAPTPSDEAITVTPSDSTDDDGNRVRKCVIQLATPVGAVSGDLFDVWRHTPDGHYPIAIGVPLTARVTDIYAPFGTGDYGYRVICRTADGDTAWTDYGYVLPGRDVRIDFGEEYVELPYNVQLQDSYAKSYESREKLDGSRDGYWNDGTERNGSYSSDLIRIREPEKAAAVRRLAHYAGACFVRTPDGCAYTANVEVSNLGGARRDGALAVSIDANEIAVAGDYQATLEDEGE